jgi:hypothetical protein
MMITEECHPEEVQAFATRRPADEGSLHYSPRELAQTVAFILLTRVPRMRLAGKICVPFPGKSGATSANRSMPRSRERLTLQLSRCGVLVEPPANRTV